MEARDGLLGAGHAGQLDAAMNDLRVISGQQPCVAVWREAYTKFKKKKGARCSSIAFASPSSPRSRAMEARVRFLCL